MTDEPGPLGALSGLSLGVFAADLGRLREAARQAAAWGAAALHFDVMDGVFTPAITGGPGFVAALDVGSPRDVHLMVDAPSRKIAAFAEAGADIISVHAEAPDALEAMGRVREASVRLGRPILAGLGLMPDTSVEFDLGPPRACARCDPGSRGRPAQEGPAGRRPRPCKARRSQGASLEGRAAVRLRRGGHALHNRGGRGRRARPDRQRQRGVRGA